MRLPYSWLREVVAVGASGWDVTPGELEQTLLRIGHEVEEVIPLGPVDGPVTVGRVADIEELTGYKKPIRACAVDIGDRQYREIICGATNFAVGDLVVVALPGATLPGGFTISARKAYGRNSDGMICSAAELNLGADHSGILVLPPGAAEPGADGAGVLGLDDVVFHLAITPDRGYCMSVRGLARELACAYDLDFVDPASNSRVPPLPIEGPAWPLTVQPNAGACSEALIELYGPHQSGGGALRQLWLKLTLRGTETAPLQASMRRAVEHRALMAIAFGDLGMANTTVIAVSPLDRGWTLYAHRPARGIGISECTKTTPTAHVWEALRTLHDQQISHGDLCSAEITVDNGAVLFGGFGEAEYGATDAQLQSDLAQLLVTTSALYDAEAAVTAAIDTFGKQAILAASRRLTKSAVPKRIRESITDPNAVIASTRAEVMRQTGADQIKAETITRFSRGQLIQLVLIGALVYVAYPFISTVPTFFSQLRTANWWWALLGLAVSALTYVGAAAALWACADGLVGFWKLSIMQVANTFAATTTPAGVGGLALSTRFLQKGGLTAVRATAAVALQQSVQVIVHLVLLILFSALAGTSTDLSHFVPNATVLYLIAGVALGIVGTFLFVPKLRRWLATAVRPKLREVTNDLIALAREPKRLALIVLGCAGTTLGAALALWASIEAFGGGTTFVTVTVVTMVGGTLASAAPTPGGVGAVEAALIGGLAAFGVPAALGVPSVLLYRLLTCWLPVFAGWQVMHWLTRHEMI